MKPRSKCFPHPGGITAKVWVVKTLHRQKRIPDLIFNLGELNFKRNLIKNTQVFPPAEWTFTHPILKFREASQVASQNFLRETLCLQSNSKHNTSKQIQPTMENLLNPCCVMSVRQQKTINLKAENYYSDIEQTHYDLEQRRFDSLFGVTERRNNA